MRLQFDPSAMARVLRDLDACRSEAEVGRVTAANRLEICWLAMTLNDAGITGGERHEGFPGDTCDLCGETLSEAGFYIDGAMLQGGWANMCPGCFAQHGRALGWGRGQLYRGFTNGTEVRWFCIAGGDQTIAD